MMKEVLQFVNHVLLTQNYNMPFGLNHRNKPTPAKVKIIAGVITGVIGAFIGWTSTNDLIPPRIENIITSILGLILTIIPLIIPLFGVDVPGDTVPTENVTEIDETTLSKN